MAPKIRLFSTLYFIFKDYFCIFYKNDLLQVLSDAKIAT
ncbi:hypothetical protein ALO79_200296 [Pseudomonas syringae pv. castaneae]|uniref:Uncharacterized protein n=1 Tax=Pseudomonas syringae pv. castaneae TaxID=264450 RepID=A0A0P9ML29_PSESX|nr:hypothetical protein ALO79_200296 [Pseudomonas syringae pv. castaneae]